MAFSAVTERGSNNEKVSDTSLGVSPSAAITVGKIAFAILAFDNITDVDGASTTNDTLTDTDGHTWTKAVEHTKAAGAAGAGVTGALWFTKVTSEIGTGDTVTFDIDSARTAKVIGLFEVTVGAGNTIQLVDSSFLLSTSGDPAAVTLSGLPSKEYLFLGIVWAESTAATPTWDEDADYTNVYAAEGIGTQGGSAATNVLINIGYQIVTGSGENFDVAGMTTSDKVVALLAFEEVTPGGATEDPYPYVGGGYYPTEG